MTEYELALEQIVQSRTYALSLLESVPESDWYRMPPGVQTNVAWQVAHLAMAEYRLCLERVRGPFPDDEKLVSKSFLEQYGRGSVPQPDGPAPESLRHTLATVHDQVLVEAKSWGMIDWEGPVNPPHKLFTKRIDALWWCSRHEMLHAGQIGLLRRLLGAPFTW